MTTLNGIPIVVDDLVCSVPRVQVSDAFRKVQSPELVASTNAWMKGFFGTDEVSFIHTEIRTGKQTIYMSSRAAKEFFSSHK